MSGFGKVLFLVIFCSFFFLYCKTLNKSQATVMENSNINKFSYLTNEWRGSYNGVPAFDKVDIADFIPAVEFALSQKKLEI